MQAKTADEIEAFASALRQMQQQKGMDSEKEDIKLPKQPQQKGIHITPQPGFSYKTYLLSSTPASNTHTAAATETKDEANEEYSAKVFINIVQHELIDAPAMKKKLDNDGNEVEGLNIPMSVGPLRSERDKHNNTCRVLDIVVHPDVVQDAKEDKTGKYREFLCQLGIQCVQNKYGLRLDNRYKLPRLLYMGDAENVPQHYIQDRRSAPRIEEVSQSKEKEKKESKGKAAAGKTQTQAQTAVAEEERDAIVTLHWVSLCEENTDTQTHTQTLSSSSAVSERDRQRVIARDCLSHLSVATNEEEKEETERVCVWERYAHNTRDYVDPLLSPPVPLSLSPHIVVAVDFSSYETCERLLSLVSVSLSPFKVSLKVPGCRALSLSLCTAVSPAAAKHFVLSLRGFVSRRRLVVLLPVCASLARFEDDADPGSKPWLLAKAISTESNPYLSSPSSSSSSVNKAPSSSTAQGSVAEGELPEDKFHLRLPRDADPYTGVQNTPSLAHNSSNMDDWELPEDRFHRKDATSSFLINQREQSKKDKWEKYEKEREERKQDPNMEYVDLDDYRPGGPRSSAPGQDEQATPSAAAANKGVTRAAEVLAEYQTPKLQGLVSNLWTELID